jgi:1,4-dihydroxy-2-naphthoate octaprenyltransferase
MAASDQALLAYLHGVDHATLEHSLSIGGAALVLVVAFAMQTWRQWREDREDEEKRGG